MRFPTTRHQAGAALLMAGLLTVLFVAKAPADSLSSTEGQVVLTVSGSISNTNADDKADFDMTMLEAMPSHIIETTTPWNDGVTEFKGVLARDLMSRVGAQGEHVLAIALNDYQFKIPLSDFDQYDVVVAYRVNGERMRIRDKGPLWIVYPMDSHESLQNETTHSKMVWQLRRLVVE